ncbi:Bromodomain-containing protein [Westerdykella ornata]|uniref:Bromodomain-containing protein n=1 Tax=Westerdykella ornata TaxID=318751 RepID=A0A6A6JXS4_WESOR|nr:Bromodomain-containing protein [Westerdykella ornata]KAF2281207.1 Bromodomain-containing protein [Westerdykella ornata]
MQAESGADPITGETVESTTTNGLRFLESLRNAKDKHGRPIATDFLQLPSGNPTLKRDKGPYYDLVKLPISIQTMEDKLRAGEYATLAQLEADCKRMVTNAKSYFTRGENTFEDAERLRKTASNWMTKNNPAYKLIRNYQAVATPVPGEDAATPARPAPRPVSTPKPIPPTPDTTDRPRRAAAPPSATPAPSKLRHSLPIHTTEAGDSKAYDGKSFQQAQEQIISELIEYIDPESELQIFQPFVNLPSRSLKDYYQLIKNPMSLSGVQKRVRGVKGRDPPTGITLLKSWNEFEEQVSLIWKNAREYNEDGSEIYDLSVQLEKMFKEKLANAKAKVEEPPQPKLKINMSAAPAAVPKQQLKLKLRQSPVSGAESPAVRSSATPGVTIDNDALLRQQRHVQDSMNAQRGSQPPSSKAQTPLASAPPSVPRSTSTYPPSGSPPATNGIKNDVGSPALSSIRQASTVSDGQRPSVPAQTPHPSMPPPQMVSRPASGSPHPNGLVGQQPGGYPGQYHPPTHYAPPVTAQPGAFRKTPLKNTSEALIPKITITTAPSLNLPKPFKTVVQANKYRTVQSVTLNLPPSHSHLQIVPYLPVALDGRPYRTFYIVNGKQYSETPRMLAAPAVNGAPTSYEGGKKKGEPLYDAKLLPGVNRIEIEVIAEKKGKVDSKDPKDQVEIEKCLIFVNLMRP